VEFVDFLKERWLKPKSIPFMFIVLVCAYFGAASAYNSWTWVTVPVWIYIVTAVLLLIAGIIYSCLCIAQIQLPKAPKGSLAVLFCIDAESPQLYNTAEFKLVNQFNKYVIDDGPASIQVRCVPAHQVSKYNLQDNADMLSLLERTNCVLLIKVRYSADDVTHAENYELQINCAVSHPEFNEKAETILLQDLRTINGPVRRQKFTKANSINVFNLTAQTLACACQYILGFVYLLCGNNEYALRLLRLSKATLSAGLPAGNDTKQLENLLDDRIFATLCQIVQEKMYLFQAEKNLVQLRSIRQVLETANGIRPDTYFYNLNMAYVHIALNHDAPAAKKCIEKCKALKEKKDWLYSDAFLSAYCGHAPTTVLSKYNKALKVPYKSLVELVDYIEFVIESEPQKVTLHLAAGLIYEAMGDIKLMKQHVSIFMATGTGINQRTRALLTEKISQGSCNVDCTHNCAKCAS